MKISIALSILIVLAAGVAGWKQHESIVRIREVRHTLLTEAKELGIHVDPANPLRNSSLTKRGDRKDKSGTAKDVAREFIGFAKLMEELEAKGETPDEEQQKRMMDFMERMMSLDSVQLKIVVAELREASGLKEETRENVIGFAIMSLANRNPAAALAILMESGDMLKKRGIGAHVVSSSLTQWAKDDPMAALEWTRQNEKKFPDLITDDAKRGLVRGTATADPKLAFQLLGELGLNGDNGTIHIIVQAAKTPEQRTAMLEALRARAKDGGNAGEKEIMGVGALVPGLAKEDFEKAVEWLDKSKLEQKEVEEISGYLQGVVRGADTGKWIDWVGKSLPAEKAGPAIRNILHSWIQDDYRAAGEWLGTVPASPVRDESVRTYAETISRYEPEAAEQWALTLPEGKQRDNTLQNIHENWPQKDEASKAAAKDFKARHGLR